MKKNNLYILLGIFVVLVIVAYLLTTEKAVTFKIQEKLFTVDSSKVDKLEIERNKQKIVIQKSAGAWVIASPVNYPAMNQFVNEALSSLKNYKISHIASDKPTSKEVYGFGDTSYTKITVYENGNTTGNFLVGNAGPGESQSYIKKVDGNEIYLADKLLWNNIVKLDLKDWRDKLIVTIPKGSIKSIEYITKDEKYVVRQDSLGKFYVGNDSVSVSVIDGITNALSNMNTQGFSDTTITEIEKPDYYFKVNWTNTTEFKFKKYFDGSNPPSRYYMKVSGINMIFDVDENYIKMYIKSLKELKGK